MPCRRAWWMAGSVWLATAAGTPVALAAPAAPAAPAARRALPDLVVVHVRAMPGGVRVGRCNTFEVVLRNAGASPAAATQVRLAVARPGPGAAVVDSRTVAVAALGPGQQASLTVAGVLVPEPGPWRIAAGLDAARTLAEADEHNNERTIEVTSAPALCLR
ncbi:MAG: hypothetical protein KIT17_12540 [Rubrivivax sp.]|nr:hypothetical protein [Rubrivivax sp.]